jgi:hypothetical protein
MMLYVESVEKLNDRDHKAADAIHLKYMTDLDFPDYSKSKRMYKTSLYDIITGKTTLEIRDSDQFNEIVKTWFNTDSFYNSILADLNIHCSMSLLRTISDMKIEQLLDMLYSDGSRLIAIAEMLHLIPKRKGSYTICATHVLYEEPDDIDEYRGNYGSKLGNLVICDGRLYKIIAEPIINSLYSPKSLQLLQVRLKSFLACLPKPIDINVMVATRSIALNLNKYISSHVDEWLSHINVSKYITVGKYYIRKRTGSSGFSWLADQSRQGREVVQVIHHFIIEFSSAGNTSRVIKKVKKNKLFDKNIIPLIMGYLDITSLIPDMTGLLEQANRHDQYKDFASATGTSISKSQYKLLRKYKLLNTNGVVYHDPDNDVFPLSDDEYQSNDDDDNNNKDSDND